MASGVIGAIGIAQSFSSSKRAGRQAREATALSVKQQEQTVAEEIRRQQYTHRRDISSIEAEVAGAGISSTGKGLRVDEKRTTTSVDAKYDEALDFYNQVEAEYERNKAEFESDVDYSTGGGQYSPDRRLTSDRIMASERLEDLKRQRDYELDLPWNPEGGIFSTYLTEREKVHFEEIAWMRKTGLTSVASITAEGQSAQAQARAMQVGYATSLISSAADWWEQSQTPANTTTTQQTTG